MLGSPEYGSARDSRSLVACAGQPVGDHLYERRKSAYFKTCNRHGTPLLLYRMFRLLVGVEAEQSGIIRAGARFVKLATPCPKLVLTINHASGAGYYAMAGRDSIQTSSSV
jgi:acetyl-CoA carboxylase carboxyltransferase component